MSPRNKAILIGVVIFMVILILSLSGVVAYLLITRNDNKGSNNGNTITPAINSFEDCKTAGYPILETYPQQCKTPGGQTFVEDVPPVDVPITISSVTVKVYFDKTPDSNNDFNADFALNRTTTRADVGTFAIEQLIAGPTAKEKTSHYFSPVKVSGTSNCSGKDFSLTINKTTKLATLKFCKTVVSNGGGDDARISKTVTDTLKQFPTVSKVIILTKDGHCFGDESGMDVCLN